MRMVNELIIRGEPPEVAKLIERIEAAPQNGWKRELAIEERLWRPPNAAPSTYCFATPVGSGPPAAHVLLWKGRDELHVSSIIPVDRALLTDEQYNQILEQFQEGFLKPVADGLDVEVRIDPFRVKLEKIISREAFKKLRFFWSCGRQIHDQPSGSAQGVPLRDQVHI